MWTLLGAILVALSLGSTPHRVLTVSSYEYGFKAPDTVRSGVVTVRLVNRGKEDHQVVFLRLDDTTTVLRAMRTLVEQKIHTTGLHAVSGVEYARPGQTNETSIVLLPGRYIILCELPGKDDKAHVSKGMLHELTVVSSGAAADTVLPPSVATVRLTDYHIALSAPLRPGTRLVRVENHGSHRHHFMVARVLHNERLAEIDKWDGKSEPAPIVNIGGASALDPGYASVIKLRLTPGRYVLACVLQDSTGATPHFLLGMEIETIVR